MLALLVGLLMGFAGAEFREWTYGSPDLMEVASSVAVLPEGGYIVAGLKGHGECRGNVCSFVTDTYILRLSPGGEVLWTKEYDMAPTEEWPSVALLPEGGFVVVVQASGEGQGIGWAYILRLDSEGGMLWIREYRGEYGAMPGRSVVALPGGNFVFTGMVQTQPGLVGAGAFLVCLGPDGKFRWSEVYPGQVSDEGFSSNYANYLVRFPDGGFVLGGKTITTYISFRKPVPISTGHDYQVYLLRTDSEGKKVWERNYGRMDAKESARLVALAPDGGFWVVGERSEGGEEVLYVLRVDSEGNLLWEREYEGMRASFVHPLEEGGCLLAGNMGERAFVAELDGAEDTLLVRTYGEMVNITSGTVLPDGGVLLVGGASAGEDVDMYFLRLGPEG